MAILVFFSFLAGIVTILSPCILPLLPIILAGGSSRDKYRPVGIILGFIGSFTFFTLALSTIVKATGLDSNSLRHLAVFALIFFGLLLTVPILRKWWELFAASFAGDGSLPRHGFGGGLLIGLSLGLVWTPCVGPILASVITLAASSTVTASTFLITLSYSMGTAIPLYLIMKGTSWFMSRFNWLKNHSAMIQQIFGVLMIVTALIIYYQLDRRFQAYILDKFPGYGAGLTSLENRQQVNMYLDTLKSQGGQMPSNLQNYGYAPEIIGGGNWLNSNPLTLSELRGKVVLIDFWTYSCVNCIRTFPHLRAWHDQYSENGLVIIGVHSPEFEFEKDLGNLQKAVADFNLSYPIVQDNDFNIWRAFDNHYWPAKYLLDKEGVIRYTHFGEGNYDETERKIQTLLGATADLVALPEYRHDSRSPETYLGYWRPANIISSPSIQPEKSAVYTTPTSFSTNGLGYSGQWYLAEKFALASPGSSLHFRFDAKEVNLVMAPVDGHLSPTIQVFLDGQLHQTLTLDFKQLYNLVLLEERGNHYLEIKFPDGGVEAYAFTFG